MLAQDARSLDENIDDERITEYERMMAAQMAFDEEQMRQLRATQQEMVERPR